MPAVSIRLSGWRRREGCDLAVKLIAEALGDFNIEAQAGGDDVVDLDATVGLEAHPIGNERRVEEAAHVADDHVVRDPNRDVVRVSRDEMRNILRGRSFSIGQNLSSLQGSYLNVTMLADGRCRAVDPDTGKTWESTESMAPPPSPSSEEARG